MAQSLADPLTKEVLQTLTSTELLEVISFFDNCLACTTEDELCGLVENFGAFLGFEYVLCAYTRASFDRYQPVHFVSRSVPQEWVTQYLEKGYLERDPIRAEVARRVANDETCGYIMWDGYDRELADTEHDLIEGRKASGMKHGFSVFCDSRRQESLFLVSFASVDRIPDTRAAVLGRMVVPHINKCRRRLDLQKKVARLTKRETVVAGWLIEGKTNWEIARILNVTESTVKYHVGNILEKLEAPNRQNAVSVLIAERYLA